MKNFSNAYSYRNVSETYKTNPWFEADFKKKQEIQRQQEWLDNYNQREAHHREDYNLKVQEMQFNGVWGVPVGVTDFTEQDNDGVAATFQSDLEGKRKELAAFEEMMKTKYNIADGTMSEGDAADKTNRLFNSPDFKSDMAQYNLMKKQVDAASLLDYTLKTEADLQFPTKNLENGLPNPHFLLQYADDSTNKKVYIPSEGVNSETSTGYIYPTQSIDGMGGTMMPNTDYAQLASAFSYFDNNYVNTRSEGKVTQGGGLGATYIPGTYTVPQDYPADLDPEMRGMYDIWRAGFVDDLSGFDIVDEFTNITGDPRIGDKYENLYGEVKEYQRNMNRRSQVNADLRAQYIADGIKKNNIMSQSMRYEVPLANTAQKQQMKSKLLALKQEAEGGGVMLDNPDDFESLIAGLNAANVVTDGEDDFRLTVTGGGTGAEATQFTEEIKLTKPQFDMLFPSGQYYQSPAIQTFNQEYLPQMLKSRSPLKASYPNGRDSFPTYYKDPQSFWTTATDSSYETNASNAGIPQSHFMEVLYYGVEGNLVSDENPKETNRFRLFLNITDPTTGILHENIMMVPPSGGSGIIDKSKVAFTISQLTDQFIYQLLNPNKPYNTSAQNTLIQAAKTPKK